MRNSDNETIFDTSFGGFVFCDQFIQISTKLHTEYIYGFGENNHESLQHDFNYKSWGIFARGTNIHTILNFDSLFKLLFKQKITRLDGEIIEIYTVASPCI